MTHGIRKRYEDETRQKDEEKRRYKMSEKTTGGDLKCYSKERQKERGELNQLKLMKLLTCSLGSGAPHLTGRAQSQAKREG